ncbi:uncharacterized protein LOC5502460 isoform X2 [Nematostella vectensis]|uniref:uncharacterized protein LOC5502460 isoform X2 n=1 Tax=Nematostella vectensis TaxID=45351 RepID=UPI00207790FB|nr:uncharacterized protein LOC5502460 isoform X2 [Nematostella vectensis]
MCGVVNITRILTQGGMIDGEEAYIEAFRIQFSDDGVWWTYSMDTRQGGAKVFEGNRDANSLKLTAFDPGVTSSHVRLRPVRWYRQIALRVQVYGCRASTSTDLALGIVGRQLYSSSVRSSHWQASNARLDQNIGGGGWCSGVLDAGVNYVINLGGTYVIRQLALQPLAGSNLQTVTSYTFQARLDSTPGWTSFTRLGNELFIGGIVDDLIVKQTFVRLLSAQHLRFFPKSHVGWMCMRLEVYGASEGIKVPMPLVQRSVLIDVANNKLYVCNAQGDRLRPTCMIGSSNGKTWTPMSTKVLSVLALNITTGTLYGLSRHTGHILRSSDHGVTWAVIGFNQWEKALTVATLVLAVDIPVLPVTGLPLTDEPSDAMTYTGGSGTMWGVSSLGVFYKPNGGIFSLVALWQSRDINFCGSAPCVNGGVCKEEVGSYKCECALGFDGTNCEQDIDDCDPNPCREGTCVDLVNGFTCDCGAVATGLTCQISVDECAASPCLNDGTCIDGPGNYSCICSTGFLGPTCEINVDDCASEPCLNGGACVDGANSYLCSCTAGYTGINCETAIRGFLVQSTKTVTYNTVPFMVIEATIPESARAMNTNWCEDYQMLCRAYNRRPVGCGRSFKNDTAMTSCRDRYNAVMLTGDPIGCGSSYLASAVSRAAGYPYANETNTVVFGECDSMCPQVLDNDDACPATVPCLRNDSISRAVFALCANSDSNFQVLNHKDIFYRNATYKVLQMYMTGQYSQHETWCRDYQRLCESYGLRPVGANKFDYGHIVDYASARDEYDAVMPSDVYFGNNPRSIFINFATEAGFSDATTLNTFGFYHPYSSYCQKSLTSNYYGLYYLYYTSSTAHRYTACTDGASESAFKVLETRSTTFSSTPYLALQVKVPRGLRRNWCREYQGLCESYNLQPVTCDSDYTTYHEHAQCRDDYRGMTARGSAVGCPPHVNVSVVAKQAGFSRATAANSFALYKCNKCEVKGLPETCEEDFDMPCLSSNSTDAIAYTVCAATESAFTILRTAKTTYRGQPYLAFHVRLPANGVSRYSTWCHEYQELCGLYHLKPTGCGSSHTWTPYTDCETTYGSVRPPGNDLDCNPSGGVYDIARDAGLNPYATSYSFAFYACSTYCTSTLPTSGCYSPLYCLSTGHPRREAWTVCRGEEKQAWSILSSSSAVYENQNYKVFRLSLPVDGKSGAENWCREYQNLCANYGLRPVADGRSRMETKSRVACRDKYNGLMDDADALGGLINGKVGHVASLAGYSDATSENSFGLHKCLSCSRVLSVETASYSLYPIHLAVPNREVYTICRDTDSKFLLHQTTPYIYRGTEFLIVKAEIPYGDFSSKYSNWCEDYRAMCRSFGKLPTGMDDSRVIDNSIYSTCKSYHSVMLKGSILRDSAPNSNILEVIQRSRVPTFIDTNNVFGFLHCDSSSYCPSTVTTSCYNGPYCLRSYGRNLVNTVCVDPDSNFKLVDMREYSHLGRKYKIVHANVPQNGVSKHETWCDDYFRLCRSFSSLPVTCGVDAWRARDSYRCRDEFGSAVYEENAIACNTSAAANIAVAAGFTAATADNTLTFRNCSACAKTVGASPDDAVFPLRADSSVYVICTDSDSNFEVLDSKRATTMGVPYTVLLVRTPVDGISRHENWCRDYQTLCATYGQFPTGCGASYQSSSGYNTCASKYNSSMPILNDLSCVPSDGINSLAFRSGYTVSTTSNAFGFHQCDDSYCTNVLPTSGTHYALYYANRDTYTRYKHTACTDRKTGFEYIQHVFASMGDTKYLVVKTRLPSDGTSKYENWCRDYQKLCEGFGWRPLACGTDMRPIDEHRMCQTEYNAVMPSDNAFGCPANRSMLIDIITAAGFSNGTENNTFALNSCASCVNVLPNSNTNKNLYDIRMSAAGGSDIYAVCMSSDSNFRISEVKPVIYKGWRYASVKAIVDSGRRSQHENWCRDYQRMCESIGKRPVACDHYYSSTPSHFDCQTIYGATMPRSRGHAWSCNSYNDVYQVAYAAGFRPASSVNAFALYNCAGCRKTLYSGSTCQTELYCMRWDTLSNREVHTVCADPDSEIEIISNRTVTEGNKEYLVLMARIPDHGQARHEDWCRDYQRMCETYGRRPLACGRKYMHDSERTQCRDKYKGMMFSDDDTECEQNVKVAALAQKAGFTHASLNNSFAFNACESNDCPFQLPHEASRVFHRAGTSVDRVVYTVCVNSDSNFDIMVTSPVLYSGLNFLGIKARLPINGTSKYENWCRDYQKLCESYGLRPTGCGSSYLRIHDYSSCRDQYNSDMPTADQLSCNTASNLDSALNLMASDSTTSNSFSFDKCTPGDCAKTLPASTCSSSLYCISQGVSRRVVHTMCKDTETNFKVIAQRDITYSGRNILVLKVKLKDGKGATRSVCLEYKMLCESYGKRPLACSRAYANQHRFSRCQETYNAVMMDFDECPLNTLIADLADYAGFPDASASNSFAFHSCNESACAATQLNDTGCDDSLFCGSRQKGQRELYTACASSDTNFDVVMTKDETYSSVQFKGIKARVPAHGRSLHENWCKDYQVLCESYGTRPTGCGASSMSKYAYARCAREYHSNMPPGNNFGCTATANAIYILQSLSPYITGVTDTNTFLFDSCNQTSCNQELPSSGCHGSMPCLNTNSLRREVYTVCRKDYETNFQVLATKKIAHRGVPFLVVYTRLPSGRYSKKSNWCYEYKALCNSYGMQPTGTGHAHSSNTIYSSCATYYGSIMLPGNQLGLDPKERVAHIARLAGFHNATSSNSFAFLRCDSCSNLLPTSGCHASLSCASTHPRHQEVYTVCTSVDHSSFSVMDSNTYLHNGVRVTVIKARLPSDKISRHESWCHDYERLCDHFDGRPVTCAANSTFKASHNAAMTNAIGCDSPQGATQVISAAGLGTVNQENSFIFGEDGNCSKELQNKECNQSLPCLKYDTWSREVYTLCLNNKQPYNFQVVNKSETVYKFKEFLVIEAKIAKKGKSSQENWCRDYQRVCESFGSVPFGCRQYPACTLRYNAYSYGGNFPACPLESTGEIARQAGFSEATDDSTVTFSSCSPKDCPRDLYTDCDTSSGGLCNLRNRSDQSVHVICTKQEKFELRGSKQVAYKGRVFKILKARVPPGQNSTYSWCVEYTKTCKKLLLRPVAYIADKSDKGQECLFSQEAVVLREHEMLPVDDLATAAGFVNATKLNSFVYSSCSGCSKTFSCGGPFNCVPSLSTPEFVYFACTRDLPISNFDVISTRHVTLQDIPYLVIHAALPHHAQSRNSDWCHDYAMLCSHYGLHPLTCNHDNPNNTDISKCVGRYNALLSHDSTLTCPATDRVVEAAKAAGYTEATAENSFFLYRCSKCSKTIDITINQGLYPLTMQADVMHEVYTVCTRDTRYNFKVMETRPVLYNEIELLAFRVRLPRFNMMSRQDTWCHDYQLLCQAYGRRPVGHSAEELTNPDRDECRSRYNAFFPANRELGSTEARGGVMNAAQLAGFAAATTTNSFAFHDCKYCSKFLPQSTTSSAGLYCLIDSGDAEFYTICV